MYNSHHQRNTWGLQKVPEGQAFGTAVKTAVLSRRCSAAGYCSILQGLEWSLHFCSCFLPTYMRGSRCRLRNLDCGKLGRISRPLAYSDPNAAAAGIWGVNQKSKELCHSAIQTNKDKFEKHWLWCPCLGEPVFGSCCIPRSSSLSAHTWKTADEDSRPWTVGFLPDSQLQPAPARADVNIWTVSQWTKILFQSVSQNKPIHFLKSSWIWNSKPSLHMAQKLKSVHSRGLQEAHGKSTLWEECMDFKFLSRGKFIFDSISHKLLKYTGTHIPKVPGTVWHVLTPVWWEPTSFS